jgi:hypothetical protein
MRTPFRLLSLCALGVACGGCPRPSGGNENANDNANPSNLTGAQQQAVERGMNEIESLIDVFSTLNSFADSRLALDTLGQLGTFGTCPAASFLRGMTGVNALMTFDFGSGCSSLVTGNQAVRGLTTTAANLTTRVATINFTSLVFAGNTIQGQLTSVTISPTPTGVNLAGAMSMSVGGTGQLVGAFDVTLMTTGRITINSATFTVENGPPTQIALAGVIVDPSLSLNLVPFQGTAQFDVPAGTGTGTEQAVITFMTETVQNGTVRVQVSGEATIEFQVPGIP